MTFAFTLAAAFGVVSLLAAWRRRMLLGEVTLALGALMLLAGVLMPTRLGPVQRAWLAIGHAIGRVTGPIALAVVYFALLTPVGYVRRTLGRSPLARDANAGSYWIPRARRNAEERRRAMERQF